MAISNYGREQVALLIGGSMGTGNIGSGYMSIGSASGAITVNTTGLVFTWDRNQFTGGSVDLATAQVITMLGEFNSVELSGLTARQFGIGVVSSGGKLFQVESMNDLNFNGTQELQISVSWQVF
jgi:hypothetical protein